MNENWTPLWSGLVLSSVWREPDHVRLVWVTMLAMKDWEGVVRCSVGALADLARVEVGKVREALERLKSPDADSQRKEWDGRRIEELADGGWKVLNHEWYRDKMAAEKRRAYQAQKKREYRKRVVMLGGTAEERLECEGGVK